MTLENRGHARCAPNSKLEPEVVRNLDFFGRPGPVETLTKLLSSGKIMGIWLDAGQSLLFGVPPENRGQTPIPRTESVSVPAFPGKPQVVRTRVYKAFRGPPVSGFEVIVPVQSLGWSLLFAWRLLV